MREKVTQTDWHLGVVKTRLRKMYLCISSQGNLMFLRQILWTLHLSVFLKDWHSLKVLQTLKSSNPANWQDWDKPTIFAWRLLIVLCKTYPIIPRQSNFEQYTVRNITLFSLAQIWKGETRTTPGSRLPAMLTIHVILTSLALKGCYNNIMHLFLYSFPLLIFYHHFLEYQLP